MIHFGEVNELGGSDQAKEMNQSGENYPHFDCKMVKLLFCPNLSKITL